MKRKSFLKKGLLATLTAPLLASSCTSDTSSELGSGPAVITRKKYRWNMVTTWQPNFPVLGEVANMFADWVNVMSEGRISIKVYGGGELVPALEAFDAVSSGTADIGSGASYYWAGKSPAAQFFATVPFGMNAQQLNSWMFGGDGLALWREVYAPFNVVPFPGGNTGVQMGGWFNKEINSISDLNGLKMRIPGLGGKVLENAGGAAVLLAGGEIYTSLERGVIDATEWIGPYHDYKMGFHNIAQYYYAPGWHEPGTELEFFINKSTFDGLPKDLQEIIATAAIRAHTWVIGEFDAQNGVYLDKLINEEGVNLKTFPEDVLNKLRTISKEVIEDQVGSDAMSRKVYDSYKAFQDKIAYWSQITEKSYYENIQQMS